MVDSTLWWQFRPGQRVMTRERIPGTVTAVQDGPQPGNEQYLVTLDGALGGGAYGPSELSPIASTTTAAVDVTGWSAADQQKVLDGMRRVDETYTAGVWYPELAGILADRLPPAHTVPADQYHGGRVASLLDTANTWTWTASAEEPESQVADVEDPCQCCGGSGEHQNGSECTRCDGAGRVEAREIHEPIPCAGALSADTVRAHAGWFRDLFTTPTEEYSRDWCRFRRASHCYYPQGLDEVATRQAGYAVWTPVDRGRCPRVSMAQQQACPVGEPGPNVPRGFGDATVSWEDGGQHGGALHLADTVMDRPRVAPSYITEAEARGNSRPVSPAEFGHLAKQGKAMIDQMHKGRSPITGLDQNWGAIKAHAYGEVRKSWGGATYDAHTGHALASDADRYALSVKPPGLTSVSVHEDAPRHQFEQAMDAARHRFRPVLENQSHHLGVFHDDDNHRIDIDPVLVVNTPHEVEAIGAHTHAIGGAYHFRTGDGYFPPHVPDAHHQAGLEDDNGSVSWKGPGHWRSYAEAVQPGYTHQPDTE